MSSAPGVVTVAVADIDIGNRLRAIDDDYARLAGESMREVGQLTPIVIGPLDSDGTYPLIAGAHRVRGAQLVGILELQAVVSEAIGDQRRLLEIDENLMRHELSPLDRAVFLAERQDIYNRVHPVSTHGGKRTKKQVATAATWMAQRFTADASEKLRLSERTIRLAVSLAKKLPPETRARIAGTWLARHQKQLEALSKWRPEQQALLLDLMLHSDRQRTVEQAANEIYPARRPATDSVDDKQFIALMSAWRRAGKIARDRFRDQLIRNGDLS